MKMEFFAKIRAEGRDYLVSFPDFPNINTYGSTLAEAKAAAQEALNGALESDFERGYSLPYPSKHSGKRGYHAVPVFPHIEIAYALKKMRSRHTQTEIARKLGISYQAYQKLENPRRCNPTVKTLERIGEVLGKRLVITWT
jgi:antitoxin HicB